MISTDVAWGYVIIIVMLLGYCMLLDYNNRATEKENRKLRKQIKELEREQEKAISREAAHFFENRKLSNKLEDTKAQLKIAEEVIRKAG